MLKLGGKKPKQERSKSTVDSIFEAVTRILDRDGPIALTTNKIAEVAGVSVGSLYQYFRNKESIFEAILLKQTEKNLEILEKTLSDFNPETITVRDLISAIVSAHFENFEKLGKLPGVLFQYAPQILPPGHFKKTDERIIGFVLKKIREFDLKISSHDPELAVFLCVQSVRSVILMSFINRTKAERHKIKNELVEMLVKYLEK